MEGGRLKAEGNLMRLSTRSVAQASSPSRMWARSRNRYWKKVVLIDTDKQKPLPGSLILQRKFKINTAKIIERKIKIYTYEYFIFI